MGVNPLEVLFTGKSLYDHLQGAADGDPQAIAGLGADALGIVQMFPGAPATPIIDAGLKALTLMQLACGEGDPDNGDRFWDGGRRFNEIGKTLESAVPTDDWGSTGSQAYTRQNTQQQDRATQMKDADIAVRNIVAVQSVQVIALKNFLDLESTVLSGFIIPAIIAMRIPYVGPTLSIGIQTGAVLGTVGPSEIEMVMMARDAITNSQKLQQVIGQYNEVAAGAKPAGSMSEFSSPPGTTALPPSTPDDPGKSKPEPAPTTPTPPTAPPAVPIGPGGGGGGTSGGGSSPVPPTPSSPTPGSPGGGVPSGGAPAGVPGGGFPGGGAPGGGVPGSGMPGGGASGSGGSGLAGAAGSALGGLMGSLIGQAAQLAQQAKSQEEKEKQKVPPDGAEKPSPDGEKDLPRDDQNRADDTARPEHEAEEASSGRQGERAQVHAEESVGAANSSAPSVVTTEQS
jgi:hypothetical protein